MHRDLEEFQSALSRFKDAASALEATWDRVPDDIFGDTYPKGWEDFRETILAIDDIEIRPLDMDRIADYLRYLGVRASVRHSGGGCATIYIGEPRETDDGPAYPMLAGPGYFEVRANVPGDTRARAHREEFSYGTPDDGGFPSDCPTDEYEIAVSIANELRNL